MWNAALEQSGLTVEPIDSARVRISAAGRSDVFQVFAYTRRLHPRDIGFPSGLNDLLVSPAMSLKTADLAWERGWSFATDEGFARLRLEGGRPVEIEPVEEPAPRPSSSGQRGRPSFGTFTVLRVLLSDDDGLTQREIADFAKVTQPRVSQALGKLRSDGLVERRPDGWVVRERAAAIAWWLERYPGPGGLETHWFGLDSVVQQTFRVYSLLDEAKARPAVSGDVAADLVAPWRVPRHGLIYAERGADLSKLGLTPVNAAEATLTLVLPADRGVWPIGNHLFALADLGDVSRASALQVLFDLKRAVGSDADQGAQVWLDWMLNAGAVA